LINARSILTSLALATVALATASPALAEDVEKKWRLSLALGGYNAVDEIRSNAGNSFTVVDRFLFEQGIGEPSEFYRDPRNDNAVFGSLDLKNGPLVTFAAQYALTKTFIFEGSIGYQKSDLGDVEVSAEFSGRAPPIDEVAFAFETFQVQAGEVERVPIQLNAIWRFRPRAKFNPYFGLGIGYAFLGFKPSERLDELSFDMDSSIGSQCRLTSELTANASLLCSGSPINTPQDLQGAEVDVGDTFEWNAVAGAEFSVKRKMAVFVDLRWVDASREIRVGFNGGDELGVSVPQLIDFNDSAAALTTYGAVNIGDPNLGVDKQGGLWDGGYRKLVPLETVDPTTDCEDFPSLCRVVFAPSPGSGQTITDLATGEQYIDTDPGDGDGRKDPGNYYVQGGSFSTDGFSLQVGFRYTF
jgi:opacity protein-like surface antigen